jgi:hypothetical protein
LHVRTCGWPTTKTGVNLSGVAIGTDYSLPRSSGGTRVS